MEEPLEPGAQAATAKHLHFTPFLETPQQPRLTGLVALPCTPSRRLAWFRSGSPFGLRLSCCAPRASFPGESSASESRGRRCRQRFADAQRRGATSAEGGEEPHHAPPWAEARPVPVTRRQLCKHRGRAAAAPVVRLPWKTTWCAPSGA